MNDTIVVVTHRRDAEGFDVPVVLVDDFLSGEGDLGAPGRTVVNLSRSWRYLTKGYYASLIAEARGQVVVPTVQTTAGLDNPPVRMRALREAGVDVLDPAEITVRLKEAGLKVVGRDDVPTPVRTWKGDRVIYRAASPTELADVLVCLGQTEVEGFKRLANRVWRAWPAPVLRMHLVREDGHWRLYNLHPKPIHKLTPDERAALGRALRSARPRGDEREARRSPSLAVLVDETEPYRPSTPETIDRLVRIAGRKGLRVARIGLADIDRLGEHDALFIRCLTGPEEPSYQFASRAEALGIPVIDAPSSITRCSSKIYLAELLAREGVPTPRTVAFGRGTTFEELEGKLGSPYVVKLPDGTFSAAVFKVSDARDHARRVDEMLRHSPLLVAQEYLPTTYDWRVTVLDGKPLFVCRYHMAPGHWQIRSVTPTGVRYGRVEALARDTVPRAILRLASRATQPLGDGLFGVDIKEGPQGPVVIEINDNPNLDTGYDDTVDGDVIYEELVAWYLKRIARDPQQRRAPRPTRQRPGVDTWLESLRRPIGRVGAAPASYKAHEVMGIELEYPVVDRDLNVLHQVEDALSMLAGHPTSDLELGQVGYSNEIFDHVLEVKTPLPHRSPEKLEDLLWAGVERMNLLLAGRFGARLLPCGMHPWFDPRRARLWRRSNRRIYGTYARLFDVYSHGWANVQASHVNLPTGRDDEAVAMMRAASALIPYLPALSANSPIYGGELQPAVDGRLAFIIDHQARLPESAGQIVPEPITSLVEYRRDILGRMYKALDRMPETDAIRHEFLNARGAVFKFSRNAMEVRVLDVQECVKMDVAIACFVRRALRALARDVAALPPHEVLVEDFQRVVRRGSRAEVEAPHLGGGTARDVLRRVLERSASGRLPADEKPYIDLVAATIEQGSLSERIAAALELHVDDPEEGFTEAARRVYIELADCLRENRPWPGRAAQP